MTIHTHRSNDQEFTIILDQTFDFNSVDEFREAYQSFAPTQNSTIVIDFRITRYIDSSALGMLIKLQKDMEDKACHVRLVSCSPDIRRIFAISRFDKKFSIE